MPLKSGSDLIQLYAILSALVLCYYGIMYSNLIYFIVGMIILIRDTILFFEDEQCSEIDYVPLDIDIRSGNKLVQLAAMLTGLYFGITGQNKIIRIIGIIMFVGDGYLALFENSKLCV